MAILEYIWLDGYDVKNIRSKIKVEPDRESVDLWLKADIRTIPLWGFDGSSTKQAEGQKSDCVLKPVCLVENPLTNNSKIYDQSFIVLCEVMNSDGTPHESNTRARMIEVAKIFENHHMWFAFEQEYTLYDQYGTSPYRWPVSGFPETQGRYYCGVGSDVAWGREVSNTHLERCLECGIELSGTNAEVMPSQWEYQTGPSTAPVCADHFWISRFILNRVAEQFNLTVKLDPKPVKGDWNGAGCHINFSTISMRDHCPANHREDICEAIGKRAKEHLDVYGLNNDERLTGEHETCSMAEYRYGESDRGASVRIPPTIVEKDAGYLEDRRPAANVDPYLAVATLMETVCGAYNRDEIGRKSVVSTS